MLFLAAPNAPNDPNAPAPHAPWAGAEGAAHTEAIRPGPSDDITGTSLPCCRVGRAVRIEVLCIQWGEIDTAQAAMCSAGDWAAAETYTSF